MRIVLKQPFALQEIDELESGDEFLVRDLRQEESYDMYDHINDNMSGDVCELRVVMDSLREGFYRLLGRKM